MEKTMRMMKIALMMLKKIVLPLIQTVYIQNIFQAQNQPLNLKGAEADQEKTIKMADQEVDLHQLKLKQNALTTKVSKVHVSYVMKVTIIYQ